MIRKYILKNNNQNLWKLIDMEQWSIYIVENSADNRENDNDHCIHVRFSHTGIALVAEPKEENEPQITLKEIHSAAFNENGKSVSSPTPLNVLAAVVDATPWLLKKLHSSYYRTEGKTAIALTLINALVGVMPEGQLLKAFTKAADAIGIGRKHFLRLKGYQERRCTDLSDVDIKYRCFTGSPEEALLRWNWACEAIIAINNSNTVYTGWSPDEPTNCKAVIPLLMAAMKLPFNPVATGMARRGFGRDLRHEIPGLNEIKYEDSAAPLAELEKENTKLARTMLRTRRSSPWTPHT
jgi:hypothetical protein